MSKLDELIAELCPDGVPFKSLGELGTFYSGLTGKTKDDFNEGNSKYITYMNVYTNMDLKTNVTEKVKISENEKQNIVQYGDIVFTGSSETLDECGMSSVVTSKTDEKLYLNSFCFGYRFNKSSYFIPAFTKHLFRSNELRRQIIRTASGVTRFNVSKKKMENVRLPVPPLEVQREIVRVLDNFTFLTAELTAELTARRKQYEFYKNELLSFNNCKIPRVKLKDIALNIYRGSGIKRDEVTKTGIPCVRYGEIYTIYNTWFEDCVSYTTKGVVSNPKYFEYGDILFAITGERVEEIAKSIAYVGHEKCLAGGDIVVLKHKQNPKYLSYALATEDAQKQKSKGKIKSKVVHSSVPAIEEIEIPLPPLDIQNRIAEVLDNFEKLCNDFGNGLPDEIAARQKQYEYYRDKLLTFKELNA